MHNPYSEDELIEQTAIDLLAEMGWETLNCYSEFDRGDSPLGRQTKSEVALIPRLQAALARLNPDATPEAIAKAIEEITRSRSLMSGVEANREIYTLLKDDVKVTTSNPNDEDENTEVLRVIDWKNPENNDFFAATQFWVTGEMYTKRPDLICFVNGIPLVLMEFKRIDVNLQDAYNDNLRDYKDTIPHLFWYNAFILLSNGMDSKVGSLTASWEHFAEWKRVHSEDETPTVSLETTLQALCEPQRLLDVVENFILFMEAQGGLIKILAKNHQYLGVNNTIASLKRIEDNQGRLGVFWHTQGSGKSISMLFFAQKVLRTIPGNWTFVVVTDRRELDNQIYKTFASTRGVLTQQEVHAESVVHLRQLLSEDHRYIFTLIQKFQTQSGERHPVLSERSDIVVITDEAHRSQYDTLALNMRTALPNAAFIAFTGTPLMAGEEKTKSVFGDYVSVYDFNQSIMDRATVPLYYENRVPTLQLTNENLHEDLEQILENAEIDEAQETRLEYEFTREYHLITREKRLETIAENIVAHFMGRGYRSHINDAMERILINDETKRNYLQHATNVTKLYKAILPDPSAHEFTRICQLINIIAQKIRNLTPPADISDVMTEVEGLLDRSIAPEGYLIQVPPDSYDMNQVDLSQIDFEQLSEQFNTEHKRVEAERLRGAINAKLTAMLRLNRSRMDYQQKFEQMIAEYNAGTMGVDNFVEGLFDFANELHQEDQRASTEEFSEEELAVFDLLTQHEPHLTVPERDEVKTAVRKLLETLKQEKLGLDWRKRTQSTAEVRETVENILDTGLPQPYTYELFGQKSEAVYQHIYDSYYGEGKSIYTES